MKRTTQYLFSMLLLGAALVSCNRMEEDVFSENPSERLQKYTNAVYDELISAPNGWEVRYFMNPESAGYAMIMQFNADGTAKVAAKNSASTSGKYAVDESLWELISEDGAIISFPTYNKVVHAFADPKSDGVGLGGDYEFVVKEHSSQAMRITGRKHGAQIYMYPLPSGQDWEEYFNKVDAVDAVMFTGNDDMSFNLVRNGEKQKVEYSKHMFGWMVGDTVEFIYRFITTPNGISFYYEHGVDVGEQKAQNFAFNSDNTALVCTDEGIDARFEAYYSPTEFFEYKLVNKAFWHLNAENMGAVAQSAYDDFVNTVNSSGSASNRRTITGFNLRMINENFVVEITYKDKDGSSKSGYVTMSKEVKPESVTFAYKSADDNATAILQRAGNANLEDGIAKFNALFAGSFAVSSAKGGTLNMNEINLVDINDAVRSYVFSLRYK